MTPAMMAMPLMVFGPSVVLAAVMVVVVIRPGNAERGDKRGDSKDGGDQHLTGQRTLLCVRSCNERPIRDQGPDVG